MRRRLARAGGLISEAAARARGRGREEAVARGGRRQAVEGHCAQSRACALHPVGSLGASYRCISIDSPQPQCSARLQLGASGPSAQQRGGGGARVPTRTSAAELSCQLPARQRPLSKHTNPSSGQCELRRPSDLPRIALRRPSRRHRPVLLQNHHCGADPGESG